MENMNLNNNYENAMTNLENSIQDGLANLPEMPTTIDVNPSKKNDVASAVLLGVAGAGSVALVAWAVFGGVKLGKFIKAKAIAKNAAKKCHKVEEDYEDIEDEFVEDVVDEA